MFGIMAHGLTRAERRVDALVGGQRRFGSCSHFGSVTASLRLPICSSAADPRTEPAEPDRRPP
jgi:hypothetical protein